MIRSSYNKHCFLGSIVLLVLLSLAIITFGEAPWKMVLDGVWIRFSGENDGWNPLLDERIPRLIVLLCTGASLAVSGAVIQSIFHNPLASPSVLGISSGGCLSVIFVFIYDLRLTHPYAVPLASCVGCFVALCLVYSLSRAQRGVHISNLILTGIAISTLLTAVQGFLLYSMRDHWQLIQTITEWESGSTIDRSWQHVHMQLPLAIIGLCGCWMYRKELNLLALGEEEAANLGVDVQRVRWRLFLCISLLTGGALAAVGMIPFFGLVFPHIVRRIQGSDHLVLIPMCMITGALGLSFLDFFLRVFSFHDISIGSLSAVLGGLFFLFLLFQKGSAQKAPIF